MRRGARAVLPLAVAVIAFGVSFGVLARDAGMGTVGPIVMSATTFAGSAQFAVASVLDNGGSVLAAIAAAVLLNARYAPMSIAVAPGFAGPRRRRFLAAQLIVDESWALSARGEGRCDIPFLLGAGLVIPPRHPAADGPGRRRRTGRRRGCAGADPGCRARPADRGRERGRPAGPAPVTDVWTIVAGLATIALKATGPVLLGGRTLPPRLAGPIELLAPAVLAALVVTQLVGGDRELVVDERLAGVAAAAVALALRAAARRRRKRPRW